MIDVSLIILGVAATLFSFFSFFPAKEVAEVKTRAAAMARNRIMV